MLKKLIRLHISDLWLCLGVVAGLFLIVNGIIAAVLLLSEGTSSVPLPSGVALPIAVGIMTLAVTVSHVSISFVQALQFGQSRRRALGLMLSLVLLEGGCSMALAAALTWVERTLFPALWLVLSGKEQLVWGGIPPIPAPAPWDGSNQEWAALLDEISSTLYLQDVSLDWWWFPVILLIGLAAGFIVGACLQRFGAKGGWILWCVWMAICFAPQLLPLEDLSLPLPPDFLLYAAVVLAAVMLIWSVWSLLHAVVKH